MEDDVHLACVFCLVGGQLVIERERDDTASLGYKVGRLGICMIVSWW